MEMDHIIAAIEEKFKRMETEIFVLTCENNNLKEKLAKLEAKKDGEL